MGVSLSFEVLVDGLENHAEDSRHPAHVSQKVGEGHQPVVSVPHAVAPHINDLHSPIQFKKVAVRQGLLVTATRQKVQLYGAYCVCGIA